MKKLTKVDKLKHILLHPRSLFATIVAHTAPLWSDELYLKIIFRERTGYCLNLKHPKTFNEKLQWLKLYNRRPEYTQMVDKAEAKKYVADIIGEDHIIPTLAVYDRAEDIDFDALPELFVLKCTHDSGGIVICKDKSKIDREATVKKLSHGLKVNYYYQNREWPYKNVRPRIIAEQYMTDDGKPLEDYKIHNFNGKPRVILLCRDRYKETGLTEDFFDTQWEHLDVSRPEHAQAEVVAECPKELDEMLQLSKQLAKDMPFVRTDFYTIGHKVYFGELTFFPASGMKGFIPQEWDEKLGDWLKLSVGMGEGGKSWLLIKNNIRLLIEIKDQQTEELRDYKFFCFNGTVRVFKIDYNRFIGHKANYFDREGRLLPFGEKDYPPDYDKQIDIPRELPEMVELAEKLSKGHPFIRIDLYNSCGKIYFGEMTFFPASGMGRLTSEKWDKKLGDWLNLPE